MSALFFPKKRTPLRMLLQDRRRQGHKTKRTRTQLHQSPFSTKKSGSLSTKNQGDFKKRPSSSLCQKARGSGATSKWGYFFQKDTRHAKILRSTTRFRSRKHSDDACSCSTRLEGTRRGFQNSTMKCSGACQCGIHGIPRKEGRRPSLTRTLPL